MIDKPVKQTTTPDVQHIVDTYGKSSRTMFNAEQDPEFTVWVAENQSNIERLIYLTQRRMSRPAATKEFSDNMNNVIFGITAVETTMFELAEKGNLNKTK